MRYRLPFPPPRRADGTALPAGAAAALAALLVVQLAVPRAVTLPEPGVVRPFALDPARPVAILPDAGALARPLFAPAVAGGGAAAAAAAPVEGARAIGIVARGPGRIGFLQAADGAIVSLSPGQAWHGWRLVSAGSGVLVFRRGSESATLPVAAAQPATTAAPQAAAR